MDFYIDFYLALDLLIVTCQLLTHMGGEFSIDLCCYTTPLCSVYYTINVSLERIN
jgi:hypothetical protein